MTNPNHTHRCRLRILGATLALLIAPLFTALGQVMLEDSFESYADTAALQTAWPDSIAGTNGGIQLSTERSVTPGSKSAKISYSADRSGRALPTPILAADEVHAKVTFYVFATNAPASTVGPSRVVAGVLNASSGSQPTLIGWFNNATALGQTFSNNLFQGRQALAPGGASYFNLTNAGTPTRAQATNKWIKFDIERLTNGVTRYYVNDILGITVPGPAPDFGSAAIGFNLGTQVGAAWFDNYSVVTNHPFIVDQPANQFPAISGSATFTVVADAATSYQWRFNVTNDIPGATADSYTVSNVQSTNAGFYSVVASNANGVIGSLAARLTIGPPSISSYTTNRSALQGGNFTVTVNAAGAPPLSYQWFQDGVLAPAATASSYTKVGAQLTDAGNYTCRVTNSYTAITSSPSVVTVISNPFPSAMTLLWTKLPGDYPWLGGGNLVRSLAYNTLSNQVLVASRNGGDLVHVLDGDTGSELYTLDTSGITGGGLTGFNINMLGVADDGAVYVGNLTLEGVGTHFKLYRYADTDPATVASTAFDGDPGNGVTDRWGDTLAVRGGGTGTQVLLTSRFGTNAAILTTADGSTFTATTLPCDIPANAIGTGVSFGTNDTFWATSNDGSTNALWYFSFSIGSGTTTKLQAYTNTVPEVVNLGMNAAGNLLGGIGIETPNALRLYDISSYPAEPLLLDWEFFTPNVVGFAVGNIAIANGRVYALNANNGILALSLNWPSINFLKNANEELIMDWAGKYKLQSADLVTGTYLDIAGPVTSGPYTNASGPTKFFRLKFP